MFGVPAEHKVRPPSSGGEAILCVISVCKTKDSREGLPCTHLIQAILNKVPSFFVPARVDASLPSLSSERDVERDGDRVEWVSSTSMQTRGSG